MDDKCWETEVDSASRRQLVVLSSTGLVGCGAEGPRATSVVCGADSRGESDSWSERRSTDSDLEARNTARHAARSRPSDVDVDFPPSGGPAWLASSSAKYGVAVETLLRGF